MSTLLLAIEFLGLSLWLGSDVFLSFVVALGAFGTLASRDQAGAMVGYALNAMHMGGIVCGLVVLLARLIRTKTFASLATPGGLRGADDCADGHFPVHRQCEDGRSSGANGFDSGHAGGQPAARRV